MAEVGSRGEGGARVVDPDTRRATGLAVMLLASVAAAGLMAFLLSAAVGRSYVTFLMPALAGWVVGAAVSLAAHGFRAGARGPIVAIAILGASIAYSGFHVLAYAGAVDDMAALAASRQEPIGDGKLPPPDPDAIVRRMEIETAKDGFWAYIAFTGEPGPSPYSPVGLLAKGGIAYGTALAFMAMEAFLCIAAAVLMSLLRTRSIRRRDEYAASQHGGDGAPA